MEIYDPAKILTPEKLDYTKVLYPHPGNLNLKRCIHLNEGDEVASLMERRRTIELKTNKMKILIESSYRRILVKDIRRKLRKYVLIRRHNVKFI